MPTTITHAIIGAAVCSGFTPPKERKNVLAAVVLSGIAVAVWPDIDVATRWLGVERGTLYAHRGITHSFMAAVFAALALCAILCRVYEIKEGRVFLFICLFIAASSHGLLDSATDGGSGIAFLAPFNDVRYFLPWRPIKVSPIGLNSFLSERGARVLMYEALYIWLPLCGLIFSGIFVRRVWTSFKKNGGA